MKDIGFGLTMTVMGMGVTLLTLVFLGYVIRLLTKLFPFKKEDEASQDKK
ncbi:MAG: OadG family protein [Dehalococcoidia bacterium]|nr:OadG family protein [Dehalococcoidia bacterium]